MNFGFCTYFYRGFKKLCYLSQLVGISRCKYYLHRLSLFKKCVNKFLGIEGLQVVCLLPYTYKLNGYAKLLL